MPPGKQATPGIFGFLFPDSCGKVQDAPPNPFSVFFPPALSIGSAFMNTTPTFCKRSGSFVFPFPAGLSRRKGRPSAKMHWCITGESALVGRKISCAFRIVPPLPRAVWESPWGLAFHAIRNINTAPTFFLRWELLCFPFPAGLRRRKGRPSAKMRRCITEEPSLAGRKIFRAFRIVPPLPRAVWESPWGLNFHEIRKLKHCSHLFSLRRGRE